MPGELTGNRDLERIKYRGSGVKSPRAQLPARPGSPRETGLDAHPLQAPVPGRSTT